MFPAEPAYYLYAAGNAARSLNPCSALANRSLAVFLAKAERSRLVKASDRPCFLMQARPLIPACAIVLSSAFTHPAEWLASRERDCSSIRDTEDILAAQGNQVTPYEERSCSSADPVSPTLPVLQDLEG